jgi:TolB protein
MLGSRDGALMKLNRRGFSPAWSPDGRRIAFSYRGEIFVVNSLGRNLRRLTKNRFDDDEPAWSPGGASLIFVSQRGNLHGRDLYVMRANGKGRTRIARTRFCESDPALSPDGAKITFTDLCSDPTSLYVMDRDGSSIRRLRQGGGARWSPDGHWLAFHDLGGLAVVAADGTGRRSLGQGFAPTWSPDGLQVAYVKVEAPPTCPTTITRIYAVNVDGTAARALTARRCRGHDYQPDWQRRLHSRRNSTP